MVHATGFHPIRVWLLLGAIRFVGRVKWVSSFGLSNSNKWWWWVSTKAVYRLTHVWHQNIWQERVFSCPLYLVDHTSVPLRTTNFLYRDRSLLPCALGRSVHPVLPRGTLFQLGYGTHHWHSNSSSVCSRRHCLRDCHRTRLSDSSLLFVHFEVSVYYYYYYYYSVI